MESVKMEANRKKVAVITDSACDLPDDILSKYDIRFVPLRLIYSGGEVRDRLEITPEQVYDMLPREIPKSSLPLPADVIALYDQLADDGYTDALHICISSGLSGTYNLIRLLAEDYTRMKIRVIDTKSLSMQEGLIVLNCARMLEKTQELDDVVAYADRLREHSLGMFVIHTLTYLRKGGRIGLVEGALGTMLHLKPVIYVNPNGIYETLTKAIGHIKAVESLVREISTRFRMTKVQLAVMHGAAPAEGEKLLIRLKGLLDVEESFLLPISPVLGVHTGTGLLGVIACKSTV